MTPAADKPQPQDGGRCLECDLGARCDRHPPAAEIEEARWHIGYQHEDGSDLVDVEAPGQVIIERVSVNAAAMLIGRQDKIREQRREVERLRFDEKQVRIALAAEGIEDADAPIQALVGNVALTQLSEARGLLREFREPMKIPDDLNDRVDAYLRRIDRDALLDASKESK